MIQHLLPYMVCFLILATAAEPIAQADNTEPPLTSREIALLERIEKLEQRLAEVEVRLEQASSPADGTTAPDSGENCAVQQTNESSGAATFSSRKEGMPQTLVSQWRNGLQFKSEDGLFSMKVGGRLHLDYAYIDQSGMLPSIFGPEHDTGEFRRARIRLEGTLYGQFDYRMEFDFAGDGSGKFTDVWMQLADIPYLGALKLGHFREPAGLDEQTSDNYSTFTERNMATALLPGRNLGMMVYNGVFDQRLTWAFGIFKDVGSFPGSQDASNGYAYTGRITGLPWYRENGRRLLHLGVSYSRRLPDGMRVGYQARPEIHLASRYLNTESYRGFRLRDVGVDREDLVNLEAAWVFGPFTMQGEYARNRIETRLGGSPVLYGGYLEASYFITGEHRSYNKNSATFGRVSPRQNVALTSGGGWGAWQVALRRSRLQLNSGLIKGGEADNWTLGLNWYLNPNMRLMLNYVTSEIAHDLYSGRVNSLQTRLQIDF